MDRGPETTTSVSGNVFSVLFNGRFPGRPGFAGTRTSPFWILLKPKMMEMVVVTPEAIVRAVVKVVL